LLEKGKIPRRRKRGEVGVFLGFLGIIPSNLPNHHFF
jgi:hypothetical protein